MYKYDCDYNKNIYDGLREFCQCERVNEEYMRKMLEKEKLRAFINKIVELWVKCICFIQKFPNTIKNLQNN